MWIKVEERRFPNRFAIAQVSRRMLLNEGRDLSLAWLSDREFFGEESIRELLSLRYGDISKWQIHAVAYSMPHDSLEVMVSSPEFGEVPDGGCIPPVHSSFYVS